MSGGGTNRGEESIDAGLRSDCGSRTHLPVSAVLPDFRPTWVRMPKPGNRAANRPVIRFVTTELKAATHRLRYRIKRMGASKSARSERADAAMTMVSVPHCSFAYSALACFRMGMSGSASFNADSGSAAPKICSGTLSLPIAIH
jgi:hypothetical protein